MELIGIQGAAHASPYSRARARHAVQVRLGPGRGAQAVMGGALRDATWRAGAMEYLPAQVEYRHTTALEADWLVAEFASGEWEELLAGQPMPDRPVLYGEGLILGNWASFGRAACRALSSGAAGELAREALCAEMAMAFARAASGAWREPPGLGAAALGRVADFVEASLHEGVSLAQMAGVAGLSRFHFTGAFRRAAGTTPHQYVIGRRLMRAKALLRRSPHSVTRIALECGFASHAHFCAVFQARFGMSPTRYRDRHG